MGNDIRQQLLGLAMAVVLGMCAALFYDVLRPFRVKKRSWRVLTHGLDVLFAAGAMLLFFRLATTVGQGQMRLYMLLGGGAGAVLWWLGPGPVWRDIWGFWLSAAAELVRKALKPLCWVGKKIKKVFSFLWKWIIMVDRVKKSTEEDIP